MDEKKLCSKSARKDTVVRKYSTTFVLGVRIIQTLFLYNGFRNYVTDVKTKVL